MVATKITGKYSIQYLTVSNKVLSKLFEPTTLSVGYIKNTVWFNMYKCRVTRVNGGLWKIESQYTYAITDLMKRIKAIKSGQAFTKWWEENV